MILSTNNITSTEQNSRLYNIGFTIEFADEHFNNPSIINSDNVFGKFQNYAYSLTRLIELLPDYITVGNIEYRLYFYKHAIEYREPLGDAIVHIDRHIDIGTINNAYIEMIIETFEYLYNNDFWTVSNLK